MSELLELSLQGYTARQIAEKTGRSYDAVRTAIKRERRKNGLQRDSVGELANGSSKSHKVSMSNGVYTYEDSGDTKQKTQYDIMREKGLSLSEWDVVSFTSNSWEAQNKDGRIVTLYQSKLSVKPRQCSLSLDDIDEFFKNHDFGKSIESRSFDYNEDGEILEIDTADLHCGLLAWRHEVGSDYDLEICGSRFLGAIDDIVNRSAKRYKKVYLCTLGDVLHIDNDKNTTTNGTYQQADGRFAKIFDYAFDILNNAIERLRKLNAPIEYVYTCGNHDRNVGYMLVKCLQIANKDVHFDISPNPQKAIHFGNCLIGLTHGDFPVKNQGTWLTSDFRKEFGESRFVEIHCGHIHEESVKTINGVVVKWLLAQCGNSYWEHQMAYRSKRGLQAFVWNEESGLREQMYYYY